MSKYENKYRELNHSEKVKYAMAMRRLNLGTWGYELSTLRAITLTTKQGNDNTTKVFARDLRKLVNRLRNEGYDIQYCGAFEYSPGKGLLHWHGLFRIKGGFFLDGDIKVKARRILGDGWNKCHGAFRVSIEYIVNEKYLKKYINKHILKQYLGRDYIRNKFIFSKGWMRKGWKEVEALAKTWVLNGSYVTWMHSEEWKMVNEMMSAWAEKRTVTFLGEVVNEKRTGYLFMEMGRIREAVGGKYGHSNYEYYDY